MRPLPVGDDQIKAAGAVGVQRGDATRVFKRVIDPELLGDLVKRAIAAVAKEEVGAVFVAREHVHVLANDGEGTQLRPPVVSATPAASATSRRMPSSSSSYRRIGPP